MCRSIARGATGKCGRTITTPYGSAYSSERTSRLMNKQASSGFRSNSQRAEASRHRARRCKSLSRKGKRKMHEPPYPVIPPCLRAFPSACSQQPSPLPMSVQAFAIFLGILALLKGLPLLIYPKQVSQWCMKFLENDVLIRVLGALVMVLCVLVLLPDPTV